MFYSRIYDGELCGGKLKLHFIITVPLVLSVPGSKLATKSVIVIFITELEGGRG